MDGGESTAATIAWTVLILGWVLPLAHVALSRTAGPCGPVGWLLFHRAQTHRRRRSRLPG